MAHGAGLVRSGGETDFAPVLYVTFSAIESASLFGMVNGAVMAGEAGGIFGLGAEVTGLLDVAGGTLRFENGVRFAEAPAGIDAGIALGEVIRDPEESDKRKQKAEPEFGALEPRRPFEIVEVDAL